MNHALHRLVPRSSFIVHRSSFPRAYTLIEVLIVAVIIVLMLGMALPVFRAITGSRSEAGAANIIASMLGRARTDALGLQKPVGVAFIYNPNTQLSYMAEVGVADSPALAVGQTVPPLGYASATLASVSGPSVTYYYINPGTTSVGVTGTPVSPSPPLGLKAVGGQPVEIMPGTDLVALPTGIGVETVCNCGFNGNIRASNGYLGFGVILFDANGRVAAQNYGVSQYSKLITSCNLANDYPQIPSSMIPDIYTGTQWGVTSQFGLVVFQREAFQGQSPNNIEALYKDATPSSSSTTLTDYTNTTPSQQAADNWLDANATPLLLDRYTGTLIQAQ